MGGNVRESAGRLQRVLQVGVALLLVAPTTARADGAAPGLLFFSIPLFTVGQVWIVLSEYWYLRRKLAAPGKLRLLRWVVGMNLISALVGAVLIPGLWAAVLGLLGSFGPWKGAAARDAIFEMGMWPIGKHAWLAITSSAVWFVVTYFVTVWIEYRLLRRWLGGEARPADHELLKLSYRANAISYVGLITLVAWFLGRIWALT